MPPRRINPPELEAWLATVAEFLPTFERKDLPVGEWPKPYMDGDTLVHVPIYGYSEEIVEFLSAAGLSMWVPSGFTWFTWQHSKTGQRLLMEPTALARATPLQVAKVLIVLLRSDRFSSGVIAEAVASGLLVRVLQRAREVVGHQPRPPGGRPAGA